MSDRVELTILMTPEERDQIEALARQRGYATPNDYLLALVELDAEDDEWDEDPAVAFRQAWHEAMIGQTFPVSTLWDNLDDDETTDPR
jgi:hypothetical protein